MHERNWLLLIAYPVVTVVLAGCLTAETEDNPETVLVFGIDGANLIAGPGISAHNGETIDIQEVTPTLLYLLGMPYADDLAGDVPPHLVEMVGFRPGQIGSYETAKRTASDLRIDAESWKRLRGLGYVGDMPAEEDSQIPVNQRRTSAGSGISAHSE